LNWPSHARAQLYQGQPFDRLDPLKASGFQTYVPLDLPPSPPLSLGTEDEALIARANQANGRLEGIRAVLPQPRALGASGLPLAKDW